MSEKILYILMRNDLASLNAGKAMAQASHASNLFIHKFGKQPEVKEWQKSTEQGYGTVLVLSANENEINNALDKARDAGHPAGVVVDPTYPYRTTQELANLIPKSTDTAPRIEKSGEVTLFRNEATCGFAFGTKEELKEALGKLPLHP